MTSRFRAVLLLLFVAAVFAALAQTSGPAFEVVDIKPHDPSTPLTGKGRITGGRPVYLRSVVLNAVLQSLQTHVRSLPQVTVRFPQGLSQQSPLVQRFPLAFPTAGSPRKAPDTPIPIEGPK